MKRQTLTSTILSASEYFPPSSPITSARDTWECWNEIKQIGMSKLWHFSPGSDFSRICRRKTQDNSRISNTQYFHLKQTENIKFAYYIHSTDVVQGYKTSIHQAMLASKTAAWAVLNNCTHFGTACCSWKNLHIALQTQNQFPDWEKMKPQISEGQSVSESSFKEIRFKVWQRVVSSKALSKVAKLLLVFLEGQ